MPRIEKFTDFIEIINNHAEDLIKDQIRDEVLLFRGHSDVKHILLPSIARKEDESEQSLLLFEQEMISKAIGKDPSIFYEDKYTINLLVKLQHFGIPTRLLDVTYNALVALYFSCINDFDKDGEVFVFKVTSNDADYVRFFNDKYVDIIANMYKASDKVYPCDFNVFLKDNGFIQYNLGVNNNNPCIESSDDISTILNFVNEPLFVSPVELSERQKRQQGAFIIFPNLIKEHPQEKEKYLMFCEINELGKEHSFVKERIIIPKEKKKEFIRILKNYGITEEFLFPDSTDIICKTIREESKYRLAKKVGEKSD